MDLNLKGRVAYITGSSRGIGRAIALRLAQEGCKVSICGRTESDVLVTFKSLPWKGHTFGVYDITPDGNAEEYFEMSCKHIGPPDILINNLGGSGGTFNEVFRRNLFVAQELIELAIPHMKTKGAGRIINISSVSGLEHQGQPAYCAAKAALNAYTKSMGRLLAKDNIMMCAVCPGAVATEVWAARPDKAAELHTGEFILPEEIANFVAWLASDHAAMFHGAILQADAGMGRTF